MLSQRKVMEIKSGYVTSKKPIRIAQSHICDLNQKIRNDIDQNEVTRIKGYEIAEKYIMK